MKRIGIILIGILLINTFISTAQTSSAKVYGYVTITIVNATAGKPKFAWISVNGEKYEEINIKDKAQGEFDNNEVIKLVNKYEREGYELFSNTFGASGVAYNYFLMRREHKN